MGFEPRTFNTCVPQAGALPYTPSTSSFIYIMSVRLYSNLGTRQFILNRIVPDVCDSGLGFWGWRLGFQAKGNFEDERHSNELILVYWTSLVHWSRIRLTIHRVCSLNFSLMKLLWCSYMYLFFGISMAWSSMIAMGITEQFFKFDQCQDNVWAIWWNREVILSSSRWTQFRQVWITQWRFLVYPRTTLLITLCGFNVQ